MLRLLLLTLAAPALAQPVTDRTATPETWAIYIEGHGAIGPAFEALGLIPETGVEVGYQFTSGDVLGVAAAFRGRPVHPGGAPPGVPEGAPSMSATLRYGLGLRRLLPDEHGAQHTELVVGVGAVWFEEATRAVVEIHPRIVVPLAAWVSAPAGLHVAVPLGDEADAGAFFGASLGLRFGASRPDLVRPEDQASPR